MPSAFVRFFGVTETGSDIGNAFAALDDRLKAGAFIKWAAWFSLDIFCEADLCEIGTGR